MKEFSPLRPIYPTKEWGDSYHDFETGASPLEVFQRGGEEREEGEMLVGEIFARNARRYPDKECVVYKGTRLGFRKVNDRVNRLTNALKGLGLRKQDRVAIVADNCHQFIEAIGACAKGGFILASLSTKLQDELTHIVNNARPTAMIVTPNYLGKLKPEWDFVKHVICIGKGPKGVMNYEELIAEYPADEPAGSVGEEDILLLYYTSGTTSLPKGAALSHKAILANAVNMIITRQMSPGDRTVIVHPLFFTAPINCTVIPMLYLGCPVVILDGFDPQTFLAAVEKEKPTHVIVVPTMLIRLLEYPDLKKYDVSSLKEVIYGSASMPVARLKEAIQVFGPIFSQIYGLTEVVSEATCLWVGEHIIDGPAEKVRRLGSCGRETINCHVRVVRPDGTDVARDCEEVGEIIIKGDILLKGYWNMPEVTAEAIRDGWFYSGDLATMDAEGYIFIVDRKKDMIISGAINIYPREIEEVLYKHPAIFEATVVGIPDEEWGEKVMALIVLKEGQKATEEEIIDYCRKHLATYKKPKSVIFVNSLPKTPTGKILKRELRIQYTPKESKTAPQIQGSSMEKSE
jgi:long-chain acyl-CoA synthetase